MYRYFLLLLFSLALLLSGVAQLTEDFSDGDFTNNPAWTGDVSKYEVNAGFMLHSNGPAQSDTAYLSTNVGNLDFSSTLTWEFYVQMDLNPSNSNNIRVYLVADNANLKMPLNGYYVRIGENGSSDALKFYKQTGTSSSLLFTGTGNTFGSSPTVSIKVVRTSAGDWSFFTDATGGTNYISEGSVTDVAITSSQFFGMWSKYTASNSAKFFYDNISIVGNVLVDNTPPQVSSVVVVSSTQLDVEFNEPVESTSAQNNLNYLVDNGIGNPSSALLDGGNPALVHLTFATSFVDGTSYNLTTQSVSDLANNVMNSDVHSFLYFIPVIASYKDLVINEIFADPSPQLGLPSGEYIEIYNKSNHIFNLNGWTIGDAGSDEVLGNYTLLPQEYVIIADDDYSVDFSLYSNVLLVANLPSYNNSSDDVVLKDAGGATIDFVTYSSDWYGSSIKANGGYSLELINPTIPCSGSENWTGSNDPNGGTPGQQNSVYDPTPDITTPQIISASTDNNATINICFSETIDTAGVDLSNFTLDNGIGISSVVFDQFLSCVQIITLQGLDTGTVYTITVNGFGDCSGNLMNNEQVQVILPHSGAKGDLIINEILYNPFPEGSDFIEIYNKSNKNIDLFNWQLANIAHDTIANMKVITSHYLLMPNEYVVLTKDSINIKETYPLSTEGRFIEMSSFPSYADNEGTVILLLPNNQVSDSVYYNDDYQFALLKETEGVSLERISFDRDSNDPTNWHSASEESGWASPTVQNSQFMSAGNSSTIFNVDPEQFSPDNDGYNDVITFYYVLDESGYVGNIIIFDMQGRVIKEVMKNELLGIEGAVSWDGLNNLNEKARIGAYVVYFEYFDLDGNVKAIKKPCVVAGKF